MTVHCSRGKICLNNGHRMGFLVHPESPLFGYTYPTHPHAFSAQYHDLKQCPRLYKHNHFRVLLHRQPQVSRLLIIVRQKIRPTERPNTNFLTFCCTVHDIVSRNGFAHSNEVFQLHNVRLCTTWIKWFCHKLNLSFLLS